MVFSFATDSIASSEWLLSESETHSFLIYSFGDETSFDNSMSNSLESVGLSCEVEDSSLLASVLTLLEGVSII